MQLDGRIQRPGLDLAGGQFTHQGSEALHALAVEGRQHQLALLEMWRLVEQDHRVAAHDRFENPSALAWVQNLWRCEKQLLDLIGVGDHHDRRLAEQAEREARAVAGATAIEEGGRTAPGTERLQQRGHAGPWGKLICHECLLDIAIIIPMSISTQKYVSS